MKRIAFARIAQETNALSPVPTVLHDFQTSHYLEGDALLRAVTAGPEVPGFFKRAELAGFVQAAHARKAEIEPVPLLSAWASSGGPLSKDCFETLEDRLLEQLRRAGRIDGMYFCLHGAMGAQGIADPESRLLQSVRSVIGNVPVVVSHDLHGNITRARAFAADAIVAYQTNPHRDHAKVGAKAGRIVIGTALGELNPTMAWRTLPMILGGGKTIDFLAPMRAVFRRMRRAEKSGEVLAASTLMCHPWNDDPALGWSTVVVTDNDPGAAERLADELAEQCWERRHEQPPAFPTPKQAIEEARGAKVRRKLGCVVMADASDVVTAGAPGDSTHLLRALLADAGGLITYCAVRDPHAIARLWTNDPGDRVALPIGGTLDPARSQPLPVVGNVLSKHDQHGFGKTVVLAVEHLRIVITEGPSMVMRPSFYKGVGLSPWRADIVVVKNFFPFLMFFLPYNRKTLFVRTNGTTDFDAAFQLVFDGPMHPRDVVDDWRPRDRMRRGLPEVAAAIEPALHA
ncbi:MAG: M81 family metallopeptidase [Myxococcota bacterium]|nr:M81 family metallopeptidase [Deltaproteobacteria bacterium]MDQ3333900.1 M81 family metallopeptidase [Myxococcota bacterium]